MENGWSFSTTMVSPKIDVYVAHPLSQPIALRLIYALIQGRIERQSEAKRQSSIVVERSARVA